MQRVRGNADNVAGFDGEFSAPSADAQNSAPFQHIKNLLSVIMLVQGRGFARLDDDDENFRSLGIRPVHDQIINVSGELIALNARSREDEFHILSHYLVGTSFLD
jgi:hypothetical protein